MSENCEWMPKDHCLPLSVEGLSFAEDKWGETTQNLSPFVPRKKSIDCGGPSLGTSLFFAKPKPSDDKMAREEKRKLFREFKRVGTQWKQISKKFKSRSNDFLKNNFFGLLRLSFRRILKYFGIEKTTKMLSMLKPSTMVEFAKMRMRDSSSGVLVEVVDIIEEFAFLDEDSNMEQMAGYMDSTRGFAVFLLKFLKKFHKVDNRKVDAFLDGKAHKISLSPVQRTMKPEKETLEPKNDGKMVKSLQVPEKQESMLDLVAQHAKEQKEKHLEKLIANLQGKSLSKQITKIFLNFKRLKRQLADKEVELSKGEITQVSSFIAEFFDSVKKEQLNRAISTTRDESTIYD